VHTQDQSDLRTALAIDDREDGKQIFDLAYVAEVLGCLHVALYFFTVRGRDGKTNGARRGFPLYGDGGLFGRNFPEV
jgi:hypothetical protein